MSDITIDFYISLDGSAPHRVNIETVAELIELKRRLATTPVADAAVLAPAPSLSQNGHPAETVPARRNTVPVAGQRTIDYLVRAAESYGGQPFTITDVTNRMLASGWKTTAPPGQFTTNVVRSTATKDRHSRFANNGNGTWSYTPMLRRLSTRSVIDEDIPVSFIEHDTPG